MPAVLTTPRLRLRRYHERDAEDLIHHINDPDIAANTLNVPYPYTPESARSFFEQIQLDGDAGMNIRFVVTRPDEDRLLGSIGLYLTPRHKRAEVGYWLGRSERGQGYMTEALQAVIAYAFDTLHLERVQATHFPFNVASGRVMLKAGMICEGTLRHYIQKNGKAHDLIYYGITLSDWKQG